jgi:hypothetical protein
MRRFLKPGDVLCSCERSFHVNKWGVVPPSEFLTCPSGCAAAQVMSGEELAARVMALINTPDNLVQVMRELE